MPSTAAELTPLIGDPARQADDLHKGLVYQLWCSVEAWVNLTDDELLFLEGAEDYDVVSDTAGTVVQIKATVGSITLRSDAVISAIKSFWLIKNNHQDRQIWLRFITTSPITTEQGNPFGKDAKGLDVWKRCIKTKDLTLAEQLRHFLATDPIVSLQLDTKVPASTTSPAPSLLKYLIMANATVVFNELIEHISWKTDSEDSDVIKESVGIRLRAFGEQQRLRPNECEPAIDHLFRIVAETAAKKHGRVLSRDLFRLEFEKATSRRYSASELASLTAGVGLWQQAFSAPATIGGDLVLAAATLVQVGIPILQPEVVKRPLLVETVLGSATTLGGVVIKGSSGMGKSTLAKLAANIAGGQWIWADFQGIDSANVPQLVRLFANHFIQSKIKYNLALDNLDFDLSDLAHIENSLAAVVRSVRTRGGQLIITTQRDLPGRLLQKMSLTTASVFETPNFTEIEIQEFCQELGCSNAERALLLAKIVRVQTSGHPQLVHARLVGLSLNSWPLPKAEDIITQPLEVIQELDVARQLLDDAPVEDRELLYRLSIISGCFRKDHVLAIAQITPPLAFAGDAFTRLVGPWIEVARGEYYRLSPLLSKAAQRNWPAEKVVDFRSNIARSFLSCGKKTLLEANEVLLQGLLARDTLAVSSVAVGLNRAPFNASPQIADQFFWLTFLARGDGKMVFAENAFVNLLLRLLQFKMLVERSPDEVDWLCCTIDRETTKLDAKIRASSRSMWITHAIIFYQARIRPRLLVEYWSELIDYIAADASFARHAALAAKAMRKARRLPSTDFLGNNLLMILARDGSLEYIVEFANAIEALPKHKRDLAIGYMKYMSQVLQLAIDRAWLKESDKSDPDWIFAVRCFDTVQRLAVNWGLTDLAALSFRAVAIIEDEYLNRPKEAFDAVDKGIGLASRQTHLLEAQKAMILYRQNKYVEALTIWRRILANWPVQQEIPEMQSLFFCQRAGNAAGQIPDWPLAVHFFEQGQRFARSAGSLIYELAFLADEAFARWKFGERSIALTKLSNVVKRLETVKVANEKDFPFHRTWKSIEQVVKWCCQDSGQSLGVETFEPPVGFCSKPEGLEKLTDIPKGPVDFLWLFLAQAEFRLGAGRTMFASAMKRASISKNAAFRGIMARLNLTVIFRDQAFNSLIEGLLALHNAFLAVRTEIPDHPAKPTSTTAISLVEEGILCALVSLAASNIPSDTFLPKWSKALQRLSDETEMKNMVERISVVLNANRQDIYQITKDQTQGSLIRMIATLRNAVDMQGELRSMFIGQAWLLRTLISCGFKEEVANSMGIIARETWRKRLDFPTEFPTPRITIPPIKVACDEPVSGFALASRILLQARFAVPTLRVPSEMVHQLEVLAG